MKKFATILLALAFIATLTVASFAAVTTVPSSDEQDLGVTYTGVVGSTDIVYSIDIVWDEDLAFDYSAGNQGAWNPETHQYGDVTGAQWTDNTVSVTVTNHSNAALTASIAVVETSETDNVTVTPDKTSAPLATAVDTTLNNAPAATFTLTAAGAPTAAIDKVATATVTIAAVANS